MPAEFNEEDRRALVNGQRLLCKVTSAQPTEAEKDLPVLASYIAGNQTSAKAFASMAEMSRFMRTNEISEQNISTLKRRTDDVIYFI